ncbi:MAG: Uma2 family endonuclease [Chloroflexi bacterium]|nr:Uma2 family endonuclease [Chloroflexota bacterium]
MVIQQRLYTLAEFEQLLQLPENQERLLELINGEVVEKATTEEHGIPITELIFFLRAFLEKTGLGGMVLSNVHYRAPHDDQNVRLPDVSYIGPRDRDPVSRGAAPEIPDLCVEVKSPSNSYKQLREKARFYLANGARLIWLIIPQRRQVEVYAPDFEDVLDETQTLSGRAVLPGFELPVCALFVNPLRSSEA